MKRPKRGRSLRARAAKSGGEKWVNKTKVSDYKGPGEFSPVKEEKWVTRHKYDDYNKSGAFKPVGAGPVARAGRWVSSHKLVTAAGALALVYVLMPKTANAATTTEVQQRTAESQGNALKIGLGMFAVAAVGTIVYMNLPSSRSNPRRRRRGKRRS